MHHGPLVMTRSSLLRRPRAAAALLATLATGCHRAEPPAPPAPPAVLTVTARAVPEPPLLRRGSVTSRSRLRLGFAAPGVLASVNARPGQVVRRGQLLARLRDDGASASLAAASASRSRAQRDQTSASALAASGSLAPAQRDDALSALAVANANVALASDAVSRRRLVAPIAGTVLQRLAEPGEAVSPGAPVLVLEDTSGLVVKLGVAEHDLARLPEDGAASLVIDGEGHTAPATVTSVSPAPLDDGLYAVEITPASDVLRTFRPGTLVWARFDDATPRPLVQVPLDALVRRSGKMYAFVVDTSRSEARVALREVAIERVEGRDVRLRGGLQDGEVVVREGAVFLEDGQAVTRLETPEPSR